LQITATLFTMQLMETVPTINQNLPPPRGIESNANFDVASIFMWITILVSVLLVYRLLSKKEIGNLKIDLKKKTFEIDSEDVGENAGKNLGEKEEDIDAIIDSLWHRKSQTDQEIRATQKRAIEDKYEDFIDTFSSDTDYLLIEVLWRHFADPLVQAADDNHILSKIDDVGIVDRQYLEEKIAFVKKRFERLLHRSKFHNIKSEIEVPSWEDIGDKLSLLMRSCLHDFIEIARSKWGKFKEEVQGVRLMAPSKIDRLNRMIKDI